MARASASCTYCSSRGRGVISKETLTRQIEYTLVSLDANRSRATLLLNQEDILRKEEKQCAKAEEVEPWNEVKLQAEWARHMVEATPGEPYGGDIMDLLRVQGNMKRRYVESRDK
ncbi:glutamate cysteine ligase [Aspergillus luchuensis]|uniref:Glutamate--cysteine ligase n=1 Tax=Aspergillus kawachii TaxID=1069201 RepID=A0A146FW06_ASPKA|nr:glutamate cysteine ligase [Aspergillus luchuensis]